MSQSIESRTGNNGRLVVRRGGPRGELQPVQPGGALQLTPEQQQVLQTVLANQDVTGLLAAVASPDGQLTGHFADVARETGGSCEFNETVEIVVED